MIKAQVVADSLNPQGDRLVSILATMPRIVLAELNTHRMLSKNSASSRAIPFKKMVEIVMTNPFVPIAFQEDHKGMQGTKYLDKRGTEVATSAWLVARNKAIEQAEYLNSKGVTKQLCNRLLEPFMWHTVLITGNVNDEAWGNFFNLRCPQYANDDESTLYKSRRDLIADNPQLSWTNFDKWTILDWLSINKGQAEIHMMALAEAIYDAVQESTPERLTEGEWHIPFYDKLKSDSENIFNDLNESKYFDEYYSNTQFTLAKIATAMAARTSYTTIGEEKEISYKTLLDIHDRMATAVPFHASPFEHCAQAMYREEYMQFVKGVIKDSTNDSVVGWCRNFKGFKQYRYIMETAG